MLLLQMLVKRVKRTQHSGRNKTEILLINNCVILRTVTSLKGIKTLLLEINLTLNKIKYKLSRID